MASCAASLNEGKTMNKEQLNHHQQITYLISSRSFRLGVAVVHPCSDLNPLSYVIRLHCRPRFNETLSEEGHWLICLIRRTRFNEALLERRALASLTCSRNQIQ